jgi:hypothetical protein
VLTEVKKQVITKQSTTMSLDPCKQNSHGTVTTEKSFLASTTSSSIKDSSDFIQEVIGDPKELKEVIEPIIKICKILDQTAHDEYKGSIW